MSALNNLHCMVGSVSVRVVFETRAKCQDSVARYKDDVNSYEINPSAASQQLLLSANPNQLKTENLETICTFLERVG